MLFYCLRAKMTIGVTDAIIDEFRFSKYIRDKYVTIINVVDLSHLIELAGKVPAEKTYDLCYLGRLTHQKHPELFVNVLKRVVDSRPDATAVIIGSGELTDGVKELAAQLGVLEKITFTGFLTNPFEVVSQSKMLVMTSRYEGFCLAAFEAMCLGLPVIASRVPVLDENIDDSCGALCDDEEDFSAAILEILENDELYNEKSRGAEERARVFGDVERYVAEMEKVLLDAVGMKAEEGA